MSQIPTLRAHIWQVRYGHIYPNPPQWFHRFLLWELIFGRPGLRRSIPPQMVVSQIPNLRAHIWQTRSWQIFHPPPNSDFTDSYSESSYLADLVLADLPPLLSISNDNFTDSYSENSYLADQVLGDLPSQMAISQIPYSEGSYLAVPGLGRSTSPLECSFYRFLLWEVIFGQPGLGRSTLSLCLKWQFHRFLLWELMFGRPALDGYTPIPHMAISQIPTLRAHIWQTRSWQIFHPHQTVISQIPTLRAHIWQARSWQIYPLPHRDLTDFYSKSSYLADQVLADLPTPT